MHGCESYGIRGGQARSAADLVRDAMTVLLVGLGVCLAVGVELTTTLLVESNAVRAAAAGSYLPVAVRPLELSSLSPLREPSVVGRGDGWLA